MQNKTWLSSVVRFLTLLFCVFAISKSLKEIIQSRKDMVKQTNISHGNDLLGLMLDATTKETNIKGGNVHFGMQALMDNCKTFFIAGHETTSSHMGHDVVGIPHNLVRMCS
jgi:cytochrome P450